MHHGLFILDYFFLPSIYLQNNNSTNGYGTSWFNYRGQVAYLLSHRCKAVLLPNDRNGLMWNMYTSHQDAMLLQNIHAKKVAASLNPLSVATRRAAAETNWLSLKPNDVAYNRKDEEQIELYLDRDRPFILCYKGSSAAPAEAFLQSLVR